MSNEPVPLMIAPNVPMAEMLCQRLKAEGIPAFYRDLSPVTGALGGSGVNPAFGVEIFVNPEDLERAEQLLA